MRSRTIRGGKNRRGAALVAVSIMMVGVAMLSLALLSMSSSAAKAQRQTREESASLYVAEAGVAEALFALDRGLTGDVGSEGNRVELGGSSFWVDTQDNGDGTLSIVSTGLDGRGGARLQVVVQQSNESFFRWAAFGDEWLHLDAQALVDSYDSDAGTYADQATNGSGSELHANEDGSTGSNGDITLDQNSIIFGSAAAGADGTLTVLGNAEISGSTTPMDADIELPPIELPDIASSGPFDVAKNTEVSIGAGEHHFDRLRAGTGSTVHVYGPATIVFDSFVMYSGASMVVHSEAGPVDFYVQHDFILNSNTTISSTTQRPGDTRLNLLSDNIIEVETDVEFDELEFESNTEVYATVYAPNAQVRIDSNFELFGALVARQVDLDSNCRIHYDETLLQVEDEAASGYEVVCWRELPYRPGRLRGGQY